MISERNWNVNSNCHRPFPPPPPHPPKLPNRHVPLGAGPILLGWKCYGNNGRNPWNAMWTNPSRAGEKPVRLVPERDTPLVDFVGGPNSSIYPLPSRPWGVSRMMSWTRPVPQQHHPPRIRPTCPVPYVKRPVQRCVVPVKVRAGLLIGHNWGSGWAIRWAINSINGIW